MWGLFFLAGVFLALEITAKRTSAVCVLKPKNVCCLKNFVLEDKPWFWLRTWFLGQNLVLGQNLIPSGMSRLSTQARLRDHPSLRAFHTDVPRSGFLGISCTAGLLVTFR